MHFRKKPRHFHKTPRRLARKSRRFTVALGVSYLALLSPALGVETILGERSIAFEPPAGYCLLNELTNGEREIVEAIRRMQGPDHDLLWIFVPCDQIAALREGKSGRLERFGYVTAVQPNGRFRPIHGVSRFEFASRLAKSLPPMDAAAVARELKRHGPRPDAGRFNLLHSGVATMDAAAVYLGSVVEEVWGRSRSVTAGVTAITVVKDLPMSVTLHGPFSGISYQILRTELRPLIGDFITRNEPGVQPFQRTAAAPTRASQSWISRLWYNLLVGGFLGAGFVGVILFAARHFRDQRPGPYGASFEPHTRLGKA